VVSVTDPYGRVLGFLDRSRYFLGSAHPLKEIVTINLPGDHQGRPAAKTAICEPIV
jgi:hypothetical protein